MAKLSAGVAALTISLLGLGLVGGEPLGVSGDYRPWGFDRAGAGFPTKPGDDFFRHSNGAWFDRPAIAPDRNTYGVETPLTNHPLQAYVTEPVKPILNKIIVSARLHVYVSQTDRGEFLIGAEIEPYTTYKSVGTFPFLEYSARHVLELFPQLERIKVLRTWTGLCDL